MNGKRARDPGSGGRQAPTASCVPADVYDEITDVFRKIKKERDRALFVLAGELDEDMYAEVSGWRHELKRAAAGGGLDVLIESYGGVIESSYAIGRLLARCCDAWEALVPATAASGATLLCLGSANVVMSEISRMGPVDPQVGSKRKERFSQSERQSPIEAFEAVGYLRRFAIESLDVVMRFLLEERSITPHVALTASSRLALGLVEPVVGKVEPYDLGALALDSRMTIEYCRRLGNPADAARRTQRLVDPRTLVGAYPTHDFVIDIEEAEALNFVVAEPSRELDDLFDALRPALQDLERYVGLVA